MGADPGREFPLPCCNREYDSWSAKSVWGEELIKFGSDDGDGRGSSFLPLSGLRTSQSMGCITSRAESVFWQGSAQIHFHRWGYHDLEAHWAERAFHRSLIDPASNQAATILQVVHAGQLRCEKTGGEHSRLHSRTILSNFLQNHWRPCSGTLGAHPESFQIRASLFLTAKRTLHMQCLGFSLFH